MRPDILAIILERQYNFIQKLKSLTDDEAIAKQIWSYCQLKFQDHPNIQCHYNYYSKLKPDARKKNLNERKGRISTSEQSMCIRYRTLCSIDNRSFIYEHMINDTYRITISRWRLSCHKLYIETGRYKNVDRAARLCIICQVLEDEFHALFKCHGHIHIRREYESLLSKYNSIQKLFNPIDSHDLIEVSHYLKDIEKNMEVLKMLQ